MIAALLLTPLGARNIPEVSLTVGALTFGSAVASMLGNLLLVFAYKLAPASRLAPFVYFQIIAATIYSYTVFGALPDMVSGIGLVILVTSGFASLALKR
ncbi:hypothetical protein ACFE33_12040 [Falsihalocynthiibacter sp. SS001]|uniref:hypothetical protein n=1 Tax=Falsihalocynthiibacter sp. SS001 TaxID=3349698 RepID=UPI0036D32FF5